MAIAQALDAAGCETFMTLLRRHRITKGLTQTALAKRLKLKCQSTVSQWESGESIPSPKYIPKLARILGIDAMELTKVIDPPVVAAPGSDAS
jgi:transcriptional regulator with XRE-family HTH domain